MTSVSSPQRSERAVDDLHVVVAVLSVEGGTTARTVDAVRSSVYGVDRVVVVGDDALEDLESYETLEQLTATLGADTDVVWILHSDAVPRPDALGALVVEMVRNDASLVGSKIVDEAGTILESVGSATDVFGEPYSGLDAHEVDLEQYDVVRDVAFVSGVSTLVRRDLLRGLGGLDRAMAPNAAGQDLSQRARLAGGRVMVVPSSEVRHAGECAHDVATWQERAGRYRSMMKIYNPVTLIWMLPVGMLLGLIEGVARVFLRQPRVLLGHVAAFGWNLAKLPSTLTARRRVRSIRQVGDEELFRYQLTGSVLLRDLANDVGERMGWSIDPEPGLVSEEELDGDGSRAGPLVALLSIGLLLLAARSLVLGPLPANRFSLPPSSDWQAVLAGYAGGWNPSGLGSLESVHPAAAAVAAIQALFGGWSGVTAVITALAIVVGTLGVGRVTARLGIEGAARYLAAAVLLAGPFASAVASVGMWSGLVAMAVIPWFVDLCVARWPESWRGRAGRLGALFAVSAGLASFAPLAVVGAAVAVLAAAIVFRTVGSAAAATAILAADLGALAIAPYLAGVSPSTLLEAGPSVALAIGPFSGAALLIAGVLTIAAGSRNATRTALLGSMLVVAAMGVGSFSPTGGIAIGGAVVGSLGATLVVASAFAIDLERSAVATGAQGLAVLAAVFVVGASLVTIGEGRLGIGDDVWANRLDFVAGLSDDLEAERALLVGLPDSLPGDSRTGEGFAYRLVTGAVPTMDQAMLGPERVGDRSLDRRLGEIATGDELRPGALLAPFGIRWLVVVDRSAFADTLAAQVDLTEVPLAPGVRVFRNDAFESRVTTDGAVWDATWSGATGPPDDALTVRLADNASTRFGPDRQDGDGDWANLVSGAAGRVEFQPVALRRQLAIAVAVLFALAVVAAVVFRDPVAEAPR